MKTRKFKTPSGATIPFTELGLGTAPLGNLFRAIPEAVADATFEAAWTSGMRYFDTAPYYGAGLAETRLNRFFRGKKRASYVVSTKVGRLIRACKPEESLAGNRWFGVPTRKEIFDYSYDGIMRSLEDSLQRLGLDHIDILYCHDIDVFTHGSEVKRDGHVRDFMEGGYKALVKLREEGAIKAFGGGINEWQVAETLARAGDFDLFLLAGRYTLLEQEALESFLPLCEDRGIGIVLGGPYNSGILATGAQPGAKYNYVKAPADVMRRVAAIEALCRRYKTKLPEAALRFPLAHPQVVSVIPGAVTAKEVAQNVQTLSARIPKPLWSALKSEGLLDPRAPTPKDRTSR